MAKAKFTTRASALVAPDQIVDRMEKMSHELYEAYCSAVTVEYALLYQDSDMDETISGCVRGSLAKVLGRLDREFEGILRAVMKQRGQPPANESKAEPETEPGG